MSRIHRIGLSAPTRVGTGVGIGLAHLPRHDAWFIGLNPQLNDASPIEAIREDRLREVMTAAKSFVLGG